MAFLDVDEIISEVRTKTLERIRAETDDQGTIYLGESLFSDGEIRKMLDRKWRWLYAFMVEKQTKSVIQNLDIPADTLVAQPNTNEIYRDIDDIWKLYNIFVFFSVNIPVRMTEVSYEEMYNYYTTAFILESITDTIGYYFENKRIYLPYTEGRYIIKYAKEDLPLTEADIPTFYKDYLVAATACEMKISGQEATRGSAVYTQMEEYWNEVKTHILTHRNKGNPRKIQRIRPNTLLII